jgi:hypothetical protein
MMQLPVQQTTFALTIPEGYGEDMDLEDQYADFIMRYDGGDRIICDGDMLLDAMDEGYLIDEFITAKFNNLKRTPRF